MLKNYFKAAFRRHLKNKWNSLINIISLAIGIASCILIFAYVFQEFSYDNFHQNKNELYRLYYGITKTDGVKLNLCLHPHSMVSELQENHPAVKHATSFQYCRAVIDHNDKQHTEHFAKVDSNFLSMFSFPLLAGDPQKALLSSDQIVISELIAEKIFNGLNGDYSKAMGKTITLMGWSKQKDYIISGILKDIPKNSSLEFDMLMLKKDNDLYGRSNNRFGELSLYFQLNDGYEYEEVAASLSSFIDKFYGQPIKELKQSGVLMNSEDSFSLAMQPMSDVYFNENIRSDYETNGNKMHSYILAGIGLLILTLACINFINLSIGQSLTKTTEIGIRKVLGAEKRQILAQYIIEKKILIISSLILGYVIAELLLPLFNQLSQKQLSISFFNQVEITLFLISIFIISLIFAGGIPALVLSRFSPHGVFSSISKLGGKNRINSFLIVGQFCLSTILLCSAFIMSHQISYMLNKDMGFNKEQVVVLPIQYKYSNIYKNKIKSFPEIMNATGCDRNFSNGNSTRMFITDAEKPIYTNIIRIDSDYLKTLEIHLKNGRNLSEEYSEDKTHSVIVNETFVEKFNLKNPIGTIVNGDLHNGERPVIVGVVKDFHFFSLRSEVPSIMLHMTPEINGGWSLMIKIKPQNMQATIQQLAKTWEKVVPDREFNYSFLDDNFNKKYQNEARWQKITGISTLFAFIISSLGLLGLASIITNSRTKEIGIRKVLGASVTGIVSLLNKDITKWVVIANLLAWPVTWVFMNKWLQNYAYHISIPWWIFALAGFSGLFVALLTVSMQTVKAASANPVKALKYE